LDLGMDSLVFVDDSPVERAAVRQLLPGSRCRIPPGRSGLLHSGAFRTCCLKPVRSLRRMLNGLINTEPSPNNGLSFCHEPR
jgi:hypothetical protein